MRCILKEKENNKINSRNEGKREGKHMKKEKNKMYEKGITLIALVITIVVLLILAAVSLNLIIGNEGILTRSKDTVDKYGRQAENEQQGLNDVETWLGEQFGNGTGSGEDKAVIKVPVSTKATKNGTIDGKEPNINNPIIPEGYTPINAGNATWGDGSSAPTQSSVDNGLVIKDDNNNEWVWVPVETPSSLYTTVAAGQKLAGSTGVKTTKYTNSAIISGKTRGLPGSRDYREPDILTYSGFDDTGYATAGFSSLANMAETMVSEYEEMIASLEKYKGFYIGRYELTANGEKTGATQTDVNWYTLYKNCTTLASSSKVKTRMIWGLQWDATCNWLAASKFNINNSSKWGNYGNNDATGHGSKKNTGFSESWKANNIYDFAGNCWEFTQEANGANGSRAVRGGSYVGDGSNYPASDRFSYDPTFTSSSGGSRPTLYLIP